MEEEPLSLEVADSASPEPHIHPPASPKKKTALDRLSGGDAQKAKHLTNQPSFINKGAPVPTKEHIHLSWKDVIVSVPDADHNSAQSNKIKQEQQEFQKEMETAILQSSQKRVPSEQKLSDVHESDAVDTEEEEQYRQTIAVLKQPTLAASALPEVHQNRKVLIKGSSGSLRSGLIATMGPSGSGKTTLINALAHRVDSKTRVTGHIELNGVVASNALLKSLSGYVMQDQLLNGYLTVRETMDYTARLRLPADWTDEQRSKRVSEVIDKMGLTNSQHAIVGVPERKGISGGERKRLCVGMELLTEPKLLFLDEPTSGLDSVAAWELLKLLKDLSQSTTQPCTIIVSIHQPQAKLFALFDHLILLATGDVIYNGSTRAIPAWLEAAGVPCPPFTNIADHLLDLVTPPLGSTKDERKQVAFQVEALKIASTTARYRARTFSSATKEQFADPLGENFHLMDRRRVGWGRQCWVLFERGMKENWRRKNVLLISFIQTIVMAVLIGTVFLRIGDGQSSVTRRQPVLFFCVINQGTFGALTVINSFPNERALSLRERAAGAYYSSAYFLAKTASDTLTQIINPIIFTITVYFLVGFQAVASKFFIFLLFMILCNFSACSLALLVSAVCKTTDLSVTVLPMVLEICRLFGGFFLSPANLPNYFSWLDALSYVKYTYVGIALNELSGLTLTCADSERKNVSGTMTCPTPDGQATVNALGLDYITLEDCIGILISYIFICRLFAYFAVRWIK